MLGFSVALRPDVLWYGFLGCVVGTLVGVLPGIGPLSGISILLPVTTVDKSNIATTVIADGFVTKAQLCKGIAAACKAAGL